MSSRTQRELGHLLEERACERLDLQRVADDDEYPDWFDALSPAGDSIEIKAARRETSNGSNRTTPGRFWIQRENHRRLREDSGLYVLVVYDDQDDLVIDHLAILPAQFVDHLISSWYQVGDGHTGGADIAAKVPWPRVFGDGGEHG